MRIQKMLDNNPQGLSDEERIRRLEVFEADYQEIVANPRNSKATRQDNQNRLDLLAALRARV